MDGADGADDVYDVVIPAGGAARRLGGVDKAAVDVGGRPLLDHVLAAVPHARTVVCVGTARPTSHPVVWCQEEPPGGGPVAAVAAALPRCTASLIFLLAADLPHLAGAVPELLRALAAEADAAHALLVDDRGRPNPLAALWRRPALADALALLGDPAGASMRALGAVLRAVAVPDTGGWTHDCDTWADVDRARAKHG